MRLVLDIAMTHVLARVRQTLVGMLGVAMGVGFSVMMAALMDGSQRDFIAQLVDSTEISEAELAQMRALIDRELGDEGGNER